MLINLKDKHLNSCSTNSETNATSCTSSPPATNRIQQHGSTSTSHTIVSSRSDLDISSPHPSPNNLLQTNRVGTHESSPTSNPNEASSQIPASILHLRTTSTQLYVFSYLIKIIVFLHVASFVAWNRFSFHYLSQANLFDRKIFPPGPVPSSFGGFSPSEIGDMKTITLIVKLIAQPLWGISIDTFRIPDHIAIAASCILSCIALDRVRNAAHYGLFFPVVFWRSVRSLVGGASPVMDAFVMRTLHATGLSSIGEGYGKQRLWGSIAWGTMSLATGALIDNFGMAGLFGYTYITNGLIVFGLFALVYLLDIGYIKLYKDNNKPSNLSSNEAKQNHLGCKGCCNRRLWTTCSSMRSPVVALLCHNVIYGFIMVTLDSILIIQLEREFHMSRALQGGATFISILSALPVFEYSEYIREKIGRMYMILYSVILTAFRLVALSFMNPSSTHANTIVMLLQTLHGFSFACNWTASVELLYDCSDDKTRNTHQAFLTTAYHTFAPAIGNIIWTRVYESYGASTVYALATAGCIGNIYILNIISPRLVAVDQQNPGKRALINI